MNDYRFGNFVCSLREELGMTQAELAERCGVTAAAVSKWENGESKPRAELLFELSQIFGVTTEELFLGRRMKCEQTDLAEESVYNCASVKWARAGAWLIDQVLSAVLAVAFCALVQLFNSVLRLLPTGYAYYVLLGLGILLYPVSFIFREVIFGGRSIGKRIFSLFVANKTNLAPASARQLILRTLFLPIVQIDFILMLVSGRSVGDYALHTLVLPRARGARFTTRRKKLAVILLGITAFLLMAAITVSIILGSVKSKDEYKAAYEYLIGCGYNEDDIIFNSYRAYMLTGHASVIKRTAEFSFFINGDTVRVVCHLNTADEWYVCESCAHRQ